MPWQLAKKVVSDSPGLVDFAIGLVNSVINLPDGQVKFFEEFKLQNNCEINLLIKTFLGLVEMMFALVDVSFNLPEWQAVQMTFFAPCMDFNGWNYFCSAQMVVTDGQVLFPPLGMMYTKSKNTTKGLFNGFVK